jgi:hypothetical protein
MDHAITVGAVVWFVVIVGGIIGVGALLLFILSLMNPFGSGH